MTTAGNFNRFDLMAMQTHGTSNGIVVRLARPENTSTLLVQRARRHQVIQKSARRKGRIQLEQWFRPEAPTAQAVLNTIADAVVANADETLNVVCVISDQPVAKLKNVHIETSQAALTRNTSV